MVAGVAEEIGVNAERAAYLRRIADLESHNRLLTEAAVERERRLQAVEAELKAVRIEIATIRPDNVRHKAERDALAGETAGLKAHNRLLTDTAVERERRLKVLEAELRKARAEIKANDRPLRPLWTALQPEPQPDPLFVVRRQLGHVVDRVIGAKQRPVDVVYIGGDIAKHAPPPLPAARVIQLIDPTDLVAGRDFYIRIPVPGNRASTLVIYALVDFFSRWARLEDDLERYFDAWQHVGIVLVVPGFEVVEFATHSYLLSILASAFPARKFTARLEAFEAPQPLRQVPKRPVLQRLQLATDAAWRMAKRNWLLVFGGGSKPPARFSALVISIKPRG
jgi:hypothetical protein